MEYSIRKKKIKLLKLNKKEQIRAEERINKISIPLALMFLIIAPLLTLITDRGFFHPNTVSNLLGIGIFLLYHSILFILLKKRIYLPWMKYLTMLLTVSIITIIIYGYHFGVDYVHSLRSVTLYCYFIAIILSGQYRHPVICLYTAVVAIIEYLILLAMAVKSDLYIYIMLESFQKNIVTYDILMVNILLFTVAGVLMYINARRQQSIMLHFMESSKELHREKKKSSYFANYDELTQLPNYKHFKERLKKQIDIAQSRNQNFTIICLGLDFLKKINQLYGVHVGDKLLKEVGNRLKRTYRADDFVSRFMGDRYLVLFPDMKSTGNISNIIRKTREAFFYPFRIDNHVISMTTGGGICAFPHDGKDGEDLIKKAESAMYQAKVNGKNSFFLFDHKKQKDLESRVRIEKALEDSIQTEDFQLVYQPKVNKEGMIKGLECLIRWKIPLMGSISPEIFIPIAEKAGLINEIGLIVFYKCCRQICRWEEMGIPPVPITVNVSSKQFVQKDFVDKFRHIMQELHVNPRWLGIEITESGIMIDEEDCINKLTALKKLGLIISIDDFGKGFSSLSRLGSYPLDTLKIDKSFVDGLPYKETSVCLVQSIIDLSRNLNLSVVAEGVEEKEQIAFLEEMGCSLFQGYYFYKPMAAEEVEALLSRKGLNDLKMDNPFTS